MTRTAREEPPCVAPTCTRPQAPGILLCARDAERLGTWLSQLDTEYALLDAVPSMQGREPGSGGRSRLASQRSPAALDVLVLRDRRSRDRDDDDRDSNNGRGVLEVLESWARLVRDERGLQPPTIALAYRRRAAPPGPVCDLDAPPCVHHTCWAWTFRTTVYAPATVLSERRLLATHLEWTLTQDWCDEFFADIRQLWSLLKSSNSPEPRTARRTCACGGSIRWRDGAAECSGCGTRITGLDVVRQATEAVA